MTRYLLGYFFNGCLRLLRLSFRMFSFIFEIEEKTASIVRNVFFLNLNDIGYQLFISLLFCSLDYFLSVDAMIKYPVQIDHHGVQSSVFWIQPLLLPSEYSWRMLWSSLLMPPGLKGQQASGFRIRDVSLSSFRSFRPNL